MNISVAGIAGKSGKIFVARRKMGGDMGGKWEFPGGKVEEGENEEACIVREFFEEFNVGIRCGKFLGESSFEHKGIKRVLKAYSVYFLSFDLTLNEHDEWRWVDISEIKTLDFTPSDLMLLPFIGSKTGEE
ncbi:MAG: (deoxy)nucleoside triphosphate pyrophosphohydrolase [Spirochaetaceae bacterium]|jgi:8-oxo-dGTP diphosphatase|nr:(deoxy)nucleoside triphosphate pyrophosphohydrolase [Spirochaetaceae bacterium]